MNSKKILHEPASASANAGAKSHVIRIAAASAGADAAATELDIRCHFVAFSSHCHKLLRYLTDTYPIGKVFHTNCPEIRDKTGISTDSILRILTEFQELSLLSKTRFRQGRFQGLQITLKPTCYEYLRYNQKPTVAPTSALATAHEAGRSIGSRTINLTTDPDAQKLLALSEEDFEEHFPQLSQTTFGPDQIAQIVEKRLAVGKGLKNIMLGLRNADWTIACDRLFDRSGNKVDSPCSYVFSTILNSGFFQLPSGLKTPEEEAADNAEKQVTEMLEAKKREEDAKFRCWRETLTETELTELLKDRKVVPQDVWLRAKWLERDKPVSPQHD